MVTADLLTRKSEMRRAGFAARAKARSAEAQATANAHLTQYLKGSPVGTIISAYMAIQSEIDPMASMVSLAEAGYPICLPVIQGKAQPLIFRRWTPGSPLIEGDFGALIPRGGDEVTPEVLICPLVAYDATGQRMGYGGGFYDRTLERLRLAGPTTAIGFAFAGQQTDHLPSEPTDQRLDAIVTEAGLTLFS